MSSREDYNWTNEAKNLKEGLPPNQNRESSPTQQNNPNSSIEERAKEYAERWIPDVQNDDYWGMKQKKNQRLEITEHFESGYKAGFIAGSSQGSEGDAVEFGEWLRKGNYEPCGDVWMRPYTEGTGATQLTADLYRLFIKSKQK